MTKEISKFLSYVLRHAPDSIGLTLDPHGWAFIDDLLDKANKAGTAIDRDTLLQIVANSDKQRFTLAEDGQKIRAAQGHSIPVDLGLQTREPPKILYHGTALHNLEPILAEGLNAGQRMQVHLSLDRQTAHKVGQRHGKPVVLSVDAAQMFRDGHKFVCADNGVWLTDHVPAHYLQPVLDC